MRKQKALRIHLKPQGVFYLKMSNLSLLITIKKCKIGDSVKLIPMYMNSLPTLSGKILKTFSGMLLHHFFLL